MNYIWTPKFWRRSTSHGWEHSGAKNNHWISTGLTAKKGWCQKLKPTSDCLPLKHTHRFPLSCCLFALNLTLKFCLLFLMVIEYLRVSPGGLSLWLILWLVVVKPGGVAPCPRLCVCYPTPMTVSCQSQNLTIVPAGVPYDSQRVFLQNNRITELRADSFGFETQVKLN